jgi:diaminopimelate decarboxylase
MKPTGPIPPHFVAAEDGRLLIGGRSADELVSEAGGTPVFVYDNNIIGGQIARFQAAMASGISLYYAVAANPYEPLLNFIGRYVDGFRVVSQGELERLKRAELAGIPMTFAGPGKTDAEIDAALRAGATLSIESEGEAERAIRSGGRLGIKPRLGVRITPTLEMDRIGRKATDAPSPFGVDANRAPELIRGLLDAGVDWRGLHMFTGSQWLDAAELIDVHRASIAVAGQIADAAGVRPPELNLGGGFGTPCLPGDAPLDLDAVANALCQSVIGAPDALATTAFSVELGRWLVDESGVYITRIIDRKQSGGRTFLVTDGGGHHLLGATGPFGEPPRRNHPIALVHRFGAAAEEEVTVTGCLCTPFDVLGDEVGLPLAEPGDLIAVFYAGAYGLTASPQAWESRPVAREMLV